MGWRDALEFPQKKKTTEKMEGQIEHLRHEMAAIRTGRASIGLLDHVRVDYYGTPTPLKQVASLAAPENRLLTVQPFDAKMIKDIEKAILASDLGLTPTNDGKLIRLPIPPLTEDRRKELVKLARKIAEDVRVHIRNIRRDVLEEIKKAQKAAQMAEDEAKKAHDELQKLTDSYIAKVDETLKKKEAEITEI
ncbi:MAG: ribosome recycling factor [Nitrospirae bacterium]|nr:MAG: ribosome recycling factor [Nitrospirota bacterium]